MKLKRIIFILEKVILKIKTSVSRHSETESVILKFKKVVFAHMPPPRAPKTEEVFSQGLGKVLGGPWGGFGALGWSLGRSWEVKMLLFPK